MHCDDGMDVVNWCLIGWPGSFFGIALSPENDVPLLPDWAKCAAFVGSPAFAEGTWHAAHPLCRKSPPTSLGTCSPRPGSLRRVLSSVRNTPEIRASVPRARV